LELHTPEQKWSLDIQRVAGELKRGILDKKSPDDVDAGALMNEVKDVLLLVRQLVQVLSLAPSPQQEVIARVSACAAEVGITAKRLNRCLNAASVSLTALGLPAGCQPSISINDELIHGSHTAAASANTSSTNATVRFRGARKILVAALDALVAALPLPPSPTSSSSPVASTSTSPRSHAPSPRTRPVSAMYHPSAGAAGDVGSMVHCATPRGAAAPTVPADVWQELAQGRDLASNPRRASLHLALNKRSATPGYCACACACAACVCACVRACVRLCTDSKAGFGVPE
jgi:hypothetical protein